MALGEVNSYLRNVLTSLGDTIVADASGKPSRLPIGTARQELAIVGGTTTWRDKAVLDARDFGAVGDGSTDNATAFADLATAVNAVANPDGRPVAVEFGQGHYVYSGGLAFTRPTMLVSSGAAVLDYTGTGKAVQLGPDGLDDTTYMIHRRYGVDGLIFTGGASMSHGIYINDHVTEPRIKNTHFLGFGNATAFGIYGQADNWDTLIENCDWYAGPQHASIRRNWVRMAGYHVVSSGHASSVAGEPDYGNSLCRMIGCHGTNLSAGGIGVWVNGSHSIVTGSKIEAFDPNVRLGSWAAGAKVVNNYFETVRVTGGDSCIQFGDPADGEVPSIIMDGLIVTDNYVNLHNTDIGITASFLGCTTDTAGIRNSTVERNFPYGLASGRELIKQANITNQTNNSASRNFGLNNAITLIHTQGGNITAWGGDQGSRPVFQNYADRNNFIEMRAGSTADQNTGMIFEGRTGTAHAQMYFSPAANTWYVQHISANKTLAFNTSGNLLIPGKTLSTGGIGVGNSASATAVGTLSKKMEVFDASGASLGFVPIYTTIT